MSAQVTVNLENLSEDDKKRFWDIVEKANKPKVWKPNDEEMYYWVTSEGGAITSRWNNDNTDKKRYALGNCFKTVEDGLFAAERLKVIVELERFAAEHNPPDFKSGSFDIKWAIILRSHTNDVEPVWTCSVYSQVTFATEAIANAAINKIGKDRLRKYYFCI